jgi:hypothetical protein
MAQDKPEAAPMATRKEEALAETGDGVVVNTTIISAVQVAQKLTDTVPGEGLVQIFWYTEIAGFMSNCIVLDQAVFVAGVGVGTDAPTKQILPSGQSKHTVDTD